MMGKIVTNLGITFSAALVDLSWERGRNREAAEAKRLDHHGCIPPGLPRVPSSRRTPESRNRTGCRIKPGMTKNTPLLAAG